MVEKNKLEIFISYASEDRETVARPIAEALSVSGLRVWFDEFALEAGDSLRKEIDRALSVCRYGVVILSPNFFAKQWPQKELDGLAAREISSGHKLILPVWHQLSVEEMCKLSPMLADRVGVSTSIGISQVVERILKAILKSQAKEDNANLVTPQTLVHKFEDNDYWPGDWYAKLLAHWQADGCPQCGDKLQYENGHNGESLLICQGCGLDAVKELFGR